MEQYVYHRVPENLQGTTLYPLNELRAIHPSNYELEKEKYKGREDIMEFKFPEMDFLKHKNFLWNDVLFFTPVHPEQTFGISRSYGVRLEKINFFKIPVILLDIEDLFIFRCDIYKSRRNNKAYEKFTNQTLSSMTDLSEISKNHIMYSCESKVRPIFLELKNPHILYKNSLDISQSGIEIITV